jgi:NAD-dependent SIR2 family protein deacetylase
VPKPTCINLTVNLVTRSSERQANPGFAERAQADGLAVADADAVVADASSFRVVDCPGCGGMMKPNIVYFAENVPKDRVAQAYSLVDDAEALLVAGSSLAVFSGYRFVRHAARRAASRSRSSTGDRPAVTTSRQSRSTAAARRS